MIILENTDQIYENKANIKINELKVQALINILSKEGIMTKEEANKELERLLSNKED